MMFALAMEAWSCFPQGKRNTVYEHLLEAYKISDRALYGMLFNFML